MTNKEIRAIAKEKMKTARGLVPVALLFFGVTLLCEVPLMLAPSRDMIGYAPLAYYVVLLLLTGLVGGAGIARASLSAWNEGVARPGQLFSSLTDGRRFLRALAPTLIIVAAEMVWLYALLKIYLPSMTNMMDAVRNPVGQSALVELDLSPALYAMPLAGLAMAFVSLVVTQLYYAIHLWPDIPIGEVLWRGGKRAMGAIGRVLLMTIACVWKPVLIAYGVLFGGLILGAFMGKVAFLGIGVLLMLGFVVYVLVRLTPYLMLAYAGLAIDVFCEKPEENQ